MNLHPTMAKETWTWPKEHPESAVLWEKMRTAHDWGYKPSELGICLPEYDFDYMTAYSNTKARMVEWEDDQRRKSQAEQRRKLSSQGKK